MLALGAGLLVGPMTDLFNRNDLVSVPIAGSERIDRIASALCETGSVHKVIWENMAARVQDYWRKLAIAALKADGNV